jgi:hypothetical protein
MFSSGCDTDGKKEKARKMEIGTKIERGGDGDIRGKIEIEI